MLWWWLFVLVVDDPFCIGETTDGTGPLGVQWHHQPRPPLAATKHLLSEPKLPRRWAPCVDVDFSSSVQYRLCMNSLKEKSPRSRQWFIVARSGPSVRSYPAPCGLIVMPRQDGPPSTKKIHDQYPDQVGIVIDHSTINRVLWIIPPIFTAELWHFDSRWLIGKLDTNCQKPGSWGWT